MVGLRVPIHVGCMLPAIDGLSVLVFIKDGSYTVTSPTIEGFPTEIVMHFLTRTE